MFIFLDARRWARVHARDCKKIFSRFETQNSSEENMTITLYAQPYNTDAEGFYFCNVEEYDKQSVACTDSFGNRIEEFEIQYIQAIFSEQICESDRQAKRRREPDGEDIDCELAKAIGLNQANFSKFLDAVDDWETHEKLSIIIAVGECGYEFNLKSAPDDYDIDVYEVESLRQLAEQFVEEGLYGEIPERFQFYIDYDAIARDLSVEFSDITIAGDRYVYGCR